MELLLPLFTIKILNCDNKKVNLLVSFLPWVIIIIYQNFNILHQFSVFNKITITIVTITNH
jgi:hypothetical protein